jgi:hypothetical protein
MALWKTRSCLAEPNEPEQLHQDLHLSIFDLLIEINR